MLTRKQLLAVPALLAFCAAALFIFGGSAGYAQTPPTTTTTLKQNRPLTVQELRGRAIYLRGESLSGHEITSTIGNLEVPANTVQCGGCHGSRGEGKTEGGITAGNLTWAHLTKSHGHIHPTGRKHGPYTDSSFTMAVVNGVDPDNNRLIAAMPRYRMAPEDMADLIAYLKHIEFDQDPGLTAESIEVGVPLPTKGALAEVGSAMREVLNAYFDELNLQGGIYNRKIKLHFTDGADGSIASTFDSARALARQGRAFAFVGGLSAGADKEMAAVATEEEVPFVGPATLLPQTGKPANRYVFYLLPGAAEQARALVNFADGRLGGTKIRSAVIYADGPLTMAAGTAAVDQARVRGWNTVLDRPYGPKSFDAILHARTLKDQQVGAIFFFGDGAQTAALLAAANDINWTPNVFLLGTLVSKEISLATPSVFKDKLFLAFPTVPTDITPQGVAEYRALLQKHKLVSRHIASQLAALAAAKTFVEGVKRAGADLSREKLVFALEGLYDFDTGLTPRLIFGPNRRIGAAGAYMVTVNTDTKEFTALGGWVTAN